MRQAVGRLAPPDLADGDWQLGKAGDHPKTGDDHFVFAVLQQCRDEPASHQARRRDVHGERVRREHVEHRVKQQAGTPIDDPILTRVLHAVHDVGPRLFEPCEELGQHFRLNLQVAVDQKHEFAARMGQAGHHRFVMAEVA